MSAGLSTTEWGGSFVPASGLVRNVYPGSIVRVSWKAHTQTSWEGGALRLQGEKGFQNPTVGHSSLFVLSCAHDKNTVIVSSGCP